MRRSSVFLLVLGIGTTSCLGSPPDREGITIDVRPLLTLGNLIDSVDLAEIAPSISRSGYIATQLFAPPSGGVGIFDSQGRYTKSLDRAGGGPGELRNVQSLGFGPGDTLWIVDGILSLHAYSPPPELSYVRTVQTERPVVGDVTSFGVLSRAMVAGNQVIPPTLFNWKGKAVAKFGSERSQIEANARIGAVFPIDSSTAWLASGDQYAADLVSTTGAIKTRLARNVDWFPAGLPVQGLPWHVRPRPRIVAIREDTAGYVWLLIQRASKTWKRDTAAPPAQGGPISIGRLRSRYDASRYFETVVEVFDKRSGALLASRTLAGTFFDFVAPGILCEVGENEEGRATLSLQSVTLSLPAFPPS